MKGLLKEAGLEETKICTSKTIIACGEKKPINAFKISSINENTGAIYRKSLCRKCEYKDKKIVQPIKIKKEEKLNINNVIIMAWR